MNLVILWTDALLFALMLCLASLVWASYRLEHLRRPWRRVIRSRPAMVAAVILLAFSATGLVDSVHFRQGNNGEVSSLLDRWLTPFRTRVEKTYSAPLATHLYSRQFLQLPDGRTVWTRPRLKFAGAHLDDPQDKWSDIARIALTGAGKGLAVWLGLFVFVAMVRKGRPPETLPWITVALTAAVLITGTCALYALNLEYHVFGTDKVGEDVLYQSIKSIRTGLVLGTLTTLVMLPFAIGLGVLAGYFRGWVDDLIQYLYTTLNSIPGVLLIAAAILMIQVYMATHADRFTSLAVRADLRLFFLCLILGITSWTGLCRLLRAETLKLREMEYVQAARALGVGHFRILLRHIVPNLFHIVLISVVLDFSGLVLAEAVLSYVNIGVDPTTYSWGNMINSARLELARDPIVWWTLAAAFLFMFTFVLAANLFSDAVRDAFDPRRVED